MAVASTPTLGAVALPIPKSQDYTREYRGGTLDMASGKVVHDLIDTSGRHVFRLRWEYLTAAEKTTITTQWDALKNATATYTDVEGNSYTVTQPEVGAKFDVAIEVTAAGELAYHVGLELREDS